MSPLMFVRLWAMVFLHYFVWSSWYVTMANHLTTLQFKGYQIGLAYGTTAVGAMVSTFFAGIVADRFFSTQKLLGTLHLIGAVLLFTVAELKVFATFYPVLLLYTVTYMACHGLTNTLTLHHSKNPAREFPVVMFMASVGWIAAGLTVSLLKFENSPNMFRLAGAAALFMGVYSFTLPDTPPKGAGAKVSFRTMLGLDALKLMREKSFAMFILCSFLICIPLSFYFTWVAAFLGELKVENAAAKLTIGQISDVVFLLLLPVLLPRLKVKGILIMGMAAWAIRFGLFAGANASHAAWMIFLGIALHGICYDFIFVMGRMYVDRFATPDIRGAAQGLHAFVTLGAGMFVGSWLAGEVGGKFSSTSLSKAGETVVSHDWGPIWLIPAGLSAILVIVFALVFHDQSETAPASADRS